MEKFIFAKAKVLSENARADPSKKIIYLRQFKAFVLRSNNRGPTHLATSFRRRRRSEIVSRLFGHCVKDVLRFVRHCEKVVLKFVRYCVEVILRFISYCVGVVLRFIRYCVESMLRIFRHSAEVKNRCEDEGRTKAESWLWFILGHTGEYHRGTASKQPRPRRD